MTTRRPSPSIYIYVKLVQKEEPVIGQNSGALTCNGALISVKCSISRALNESTTKSTSCMCLPSPLQSPTIPCCTLRKPDLNQTLNSLNIYICTGVRFKNYIIIIPQYRLRLISCPDPLGSAWRCLLCASLRVVWKQTNPSLVPRRYRYP